MKELKKKKFLKEYMKIVKEIEEKKELNKYYERNTKKKTPKGSDRVR